MLQSKTRQLFSAAIMTLLSAALAQVSKNLPVTPVPLSAVLVAVFLAGAMLNRKSALLSVSAYVVLGFFGAPIFPGFSGGIHILAGPTGGFLISYPLVAVLIACMTEKWGRGFLNYALFMVLSLPVCYAIGTVQLLIITKAGVQNALAMAVKPFLLPDLIMCITAAAVAAAADRVLAGKVASKGAKRVDNRSV